MSHNYVHRPTFIITGSRQHPYPMMVIDGLSRLLSSFRGMGQGQPIIRLVEGGNRDSLTSVDYVTALWSYEHPSEVELVTREANWDRYGRRAGPLRNEAMAEEFPDASVIAFPSGPSKGTRGMMEIAERRHMPLFTYDIPGDPYAAP